MNWILIGILVVVLFLIIKFREGKHKFSFVIILLVLLFLGISFWNVYSVHKLNLTTFDGTVNAGKVYFSWLGGLFSNTKAITTYAIKQNWSFQNNSSSNIGK